MYYTDLVTGEFFRADHLVENELEGRLQAFEESKTKAKGKNKEKLIDEATAAEYQNILAQVKMLHTTFSFIILTIVDNRLIIMTPMHLLISSLASISILQRTKIKFLSLSLST